jgi:PIN domain nuclease of toxin-antitoxin system
MLNLDTHIVVYTLDGTLTRRELQRLSAEPLGISAIVFWELAKLVQLGRVEIDLDEASSLLEIFHVWPLDLEIARASTRLDFRSDPADEIIAATSVVHGAPLVTRDRRLLRSRIVPLA